MCVPSDTERERIEKNKGPCVGAALLCVGTSSVQTLDCFLTVAFKVHMTEKCMKQAASHSHTRKRTYRDAACGASVGKRYS